MGGIGALHIRGKTEWVLFFLMEATCNCSFSRKGAYGYPKGHRFEGGDTKESYRAKMTHSEGGKFLGKCVSH